ncbi:hypothetical protein ENUP19_0347G0007 [Entamoeba nuttalli]|uniref:Meiotic check point regulator, putative n=2 Tax=Entamoeba nuttalli TaxID=412467 RepID=K2H8G8_ENTNP|nr:meiotic check point regulator, putative [Entamoeba nuttalli P19]EKE42912.1 meiotic check point regulator, putative [Entamoeba nuttalli P19]|eukprot:XP_008854757.1 meiotic check point regulator, putative [Entamoeba nuttalli P19]
MNQNNIKSLLENVIQSVGGNEIHNNIIKQFYQLVDQNIENKLNSLVNVPLDNLVCETNNAINHLLSPIFHFLLPFLTSTTKEPEMKFNDTILTYLKRFDLMKNELPVLPLPQKEGFKEVLDLLDVSKKIDVNGDNIEECSFELISLIDKKISLPSGRNLLYFNQIEMDEDDIVIEGTNNSIPIPYTLSTQTKDIIEFTNAITFGLCGSSTIDINNHLELDPISVGKFFGKCLRGGFMPLEKDFLFKTLTMQDQRIDAAVLLGLIIQFRLTNNPIIDEISQIMLNTSSIGSPSLESQSLALITLAFNSQSNPSKDKDNIILSHLCSPLPTNTIGFHHIWSSCFALGCLHFTKGLDFNQIEIMKRLLFGTYYSTLQQYCNPIQYQESFNENCNYNNRVSTLVGIPSSCICLSLSYFNTYNKDIIQLLTIDESLQAIANSRPDDIFIRILSICLIKFDSILPSEEWIYSNIPQNLKSKKFCVFELMNAKFAIVSACCYAISLRYAGTLSKPIKQLFIHFLNKLTSNLNCAISSKNKEAHLNIPHFDRYQKIILLSLSMVMAGSQDTEVMNVIKSIYPIVDEYLTYGSYSILSTCIGLINAGFGEYSIEPSNENIPLLIASFYPLFEPFFNNNIIYPKYLQYLSVATLKKRMYYSYNYTTKQYEKCNANLILSLPGQQFYCQESIPIQLPSLLPPIQFVYEIIPNNTSFLFNSLKVNEDGERVLRVKDAPLIDYYDDLPDIHSSNSIIQKMEQSIKNTLDWMTSIARTNYRTPIDTQIVKLLIYAFQNSNDIKMKIIAESVNILINE